MKANAIGNKTLYFKNKTKDTKFSYRQYVKVIGCMNLKFKQILLNGDAFCLGNLGYFQIKKLKISDEKRFSTFYRFVTIDGVKKREKIFTNPLDDYISSLRWTQNKQVQFQFWRINTLLNLRKDIIEVLKDETGHKRFIEK